MVYQQSSLLAHEGGTPPIMTPNLLGAHPSCLNAKFQLWFSDYLYQHVWGTIISMNPLQLYQLILNSISNPMILNTNMLGAWVICRFFTQIKSTLTIIINNIITLFQTQLLEKTIRPQQLLACFCSGHVFTSVVDKETHFRSLDCQDTTPSAKVNKCLGVDFLPSRSPPCQHM